MTLLPDARRQLIDAANRRAARGRLGRLANDALWLLGGTPGRGEGFVKTALRRLRRSPAAVLAGATLLAGGTAAAAVIGLNASPSKPLAGHLPPTRSNGPHAATVGVPPRAYRIVVTPSMLAGTVGWMSTLTYTSGGQVTLRVGTLGVATTNMPLFGGVDFPPSGTASASSGQIVEYVLTTSKVAAVRIGAVAIATRRATGLPEGDRVAVALVPATIGPLVIPAAGATLTPYVPIPANRHETRARRVQAVTLLPLDSRGQVLPYAIPRAPLIEATRPLVPPGASRRTQNQATSECGLSRKSHSSLVQTAGHVVVAPTPVPDIVGQVFLACADAEYELNGYTLAAAVLVDAHRPGGPIGPIPASHMLTDSATTVALNAGSQALDLVARRLANAWLVVQGGTDNAMRLDVLNAVRAHGIAIGRVSRHGSRG